VAQFEVASLLADEGPNLVKLELGAGEVHERLILTVRAAIPASTSSFITVLWENIGQTGGCAHRPASTQTVHGG
jgi:hypothetical protein